MNILYKGRLYCMIFIIATVGICVSARVRTIQAERDFDQQLRKSTLLMALFYESDNKAHSKSQKDKMGSFFRMYEAVSSKKMYDDADIIFTKLNMKNNAARAIAGRYGVTQSPCFILFIKGKPVVDDSGNIAMLKGFAPEAELHKFIQFYFNNDIKKSVQQKESNRKERDVKAQEESDPYFYPAVYYAPEYDSSWQKPLKYDAEGNEIQ